MKLKYKELPYRLAFHFIGSVKEPSFQPQQFQCCSGITSSAKTTYQNEAALPSNDNAIKSILFDTNYIYSVVIVTAAPL